jgi:HPt (histidine-containing phosphotransfer) domain-containing protein
MFEHLDKGVLTALQQVMEDDYGSLLDTFITDSEERLLAIQQACHQADSHALRQAAHSLKGSCSNMGAPMLAELCRQLESSGRQGALQEAEVLLEQTQRELAIVRILLKSERHRGTQPEA